MSTVLPPGLNCRNFRARGPGFSTRVGVTLGTHRSLRGTVAFCLFGTALQIIVADTIDLVRQVHPLCNVISKAPEVDNVVACP
jgi:hypothetical protein